MPENLDSLRELLAFGFINEVEFERRSAALGAPSLKENQCENKSQSAHNSQTSSPYSSLQNSSEFVFVNKYDLPVSDNSSNLSNSYMFSNNYGSGYSLPQESPTAVNYDRYGQVADNGLHSSWFMVNSGNLLGEDSLGAGNLECEIINEIVNLNQECDPVVSDEDLPVTAWSLFGAEEDYDYDQIVIEKVYEAENVSAVSDPVPSPYDSTDAYPSVEVVAPVTEIALPVVATTATPQLDVAKSIKAPHVYTEEELDLMNWIKFNMFQMRRDSSLSSQSREVQRAAQGSQQMNSAEYYSAYFDDLESVYQDEYEMYIPEPEKLKDYCPPGQNFRRRNRRMTLAVLRWIDFKQEELAFSSWYEEAEMEDEYDDFYGLDDM